MNKPTAPALIYSGTNINTQQTRLSTQSKHTDGAAYEHETEGAHRPSVPASDAYCIPATDPSVAGVAGGCEKKRSHVVLTLFSMLLHTLVTTRGPWVVNHALLGVNHTH